MDTTPGSVEDARVALVVGHSKPLTSGCSHGMSGMEVVTTCVCLTLTGKFHRHAQNARIENTDAKSHCLSQ